jgi:hypothetical protein
MCLGVTTDLHTGSLLSPLCRSVATFGHIILPPRQPVFALSHVCRSVVTIGHSILQCIRV